MTEQNSQWKPEYRVQADFGLSAELGEFFDQLQREGAKKSEICRRGIEALFLQRQLDKGTS